jgi:hypothetical protein
MNAAAEIYAEGKNFTLTRHLDPTDRQVLANIDAKKIIVPIKIRSKGNEKLIKIANYETDDTLLHKHIEEINRTYTYKCYTATFILCRKVLENLILNILRAKYPENSLEHRAKYIDMNKGRIADFSVLLTNLRESSKDFIPPYNKLTNRICQLAEGFKDDANDMTHSLYHVATKKEIDEKDFQGILDLIKKLEKLIKPKSMHISF